MKGADKLQGGAKREHGSDRDEEDVGGPKECPSASTHIVQCQLRGHLILNRPRTTEGKGSLTQTGQEYLNFVTLNISLILVISYWYMVFYYFSFIYKSIHVHISYILARFHQTELLTDKINKLFFFFSTFDDVKTTNYKYLKEGLSLVVLFLTANFKPFLSLHRLIERFLKIFIFTKR